MSPAINTYNLRAPSGYPSTHAAKPAGSCGCSPACPQCGGLSCVCRPRFFAGQLLSEVELNEFMDYVRERNRQQNRLLGAGVVCGLEVSCDPCGGGSVTVGAGHAISPCGEDIVVCDAVSVPVCDLINACIERERAAWNCEPFGRPRSECTDRVEEWILSIRYDEQVSRPMSVLRAAATGSCSCGGSATKAAPSGRCATPGCSPVKQTRAYQAECEPTVVCETFSFSMAKKVVDYSDQRGASERESPFARCQNDLARSLPKKPTAANASPQAWHDWCCDVHAALPQILTRHALHDCTLLARLRGVPCPAVGDPDFAKLITEAESAFNAIAGDLLLSCLCSLLLPPCPAPVDDDRVPLATIKVQRDPCTVASICNWDVRSIVLTPQAITHWLSLTSLPDLLRNVVERLCCRTVSRQTDNSGVRRSANVGEPVPFLAAMASAMSANQGTEAAMPRLVDSLFEAQPRLTKVQREQPMEFVIAHDVVAPLLRGASGSWREGFRAPREEDEE